MNQARSLSPTIHRRTLLKASAALGLAPFPTMATVRQTEEPLPNELVIDIALGPASLDPAQARSIFDWSIIHSIYDSLLNLNRDGELAPLAAETFVATDATTFDVTLRADLTFHDGTPVRADAIERSIRHVQDSSGPAAGSFGIIERIDLIDDRSARIVTSVPAPWLPSQLAPWMVLFPESSTTESFETSPVGSGPFRFAGMSAGDWIDLELNLDYFPGSPKGQPLAERVRFRYVPESSTRVANLSTGVANLIVDVNQDQMPAIDTAGGSTIEEPVLGVSFLRLVNDVPPFDDPLVRRAINHALDVESIAQTLMSAQSHRLASIYPDTRSIGFDPDLAPLAYDPDLALSLLADAGLPAGFETAFQYTSGGREDVMQAIAANLAEVGIDVTLEATDLATFNGTWREPDSAPIRFVSWRPVYDPHTLLSLMFAGTGFLSRFADDEADRLIAAGASEIEPSARLELYRELGRRFQVSPPAAFLWNLTATYGVREFGVGWSPRGDEYVIPTRTEG